MSERILKIGLGELQTVRVTLKGYGVTYETTIDHLNNMAREFQSNPSLCRGLERLQQAIQEFTRDTSVLDIEFSVPVSD